MKVTLRLRAHDTTLWHCTVSGVHQGDAPARLSKWPLLPASLVQETSRHSKVSDVVAYARLRFPQAVRDAHTTLATRCTLTLEEAHRVKEARNRTIKAWGVIPELEHLHRSRKRKSCQSARRDAGRRRAEGARVEGDQEGDQEDEKDEEDDEVANMHVDVEDTAAASAAPPGPKRCVELLQACYTYASAKKVQIDAPSN